MNILAPITVTAAMIAAGTTIAEPAVGETAWVASGTYVVGDLRIRATTHREYYCVLGHTGIATLPENDPTRWLDKSPTQRFAPFDVYTNTAAATVTSLTYVLLPNYFNAIALYGMTGTNLTVTVKDAPAGAVIYTHTSSLSEDPVGWYEFLFLPLRLITKRILTGIPIRPDAEVTVTITAAVGEAVSLGMFNVGDYRELAADGLTTYGASAEPVSNSYVKANADGTISIIRRSSATSMRAVIGMPQASADSALMVLQEFLDTPVSWIATDYTGYAGLNVFGLGSASVGYDGVSHATISLNVKGII